MRLTLAICLLPLAALAQQGTCRVDSDCTLSNFEGCCGGCCRSPRSAVSVEELNRQQRMCATVDCVRLRCEAVECANLNADEEAAKRAVCRGGQCVTVSEPRPPPEPACRVDSDCTMTTFTGCCGQCCPRPPRAIGVKDLKRMQDSCATAACPPSLCAAKKCAAPTARPEEIAVCRGGACVGEAVRAECRADGDCELVPAPTSGCCSSQWLARALERPHIMDESPRPPPPPPQGGAKPGEPKFGLSTGSSGAGCGACPAMPPARAACRSARCVVQPMKR